MNFREFINVIKKQVEEQIPKDVTVTISLTQKNNGVEKIGLIFKPKDVSLSQTIYLEEYYANFQKKGDITEIVNSLLHVYENIRVPTPANLECLTEYAKVKDKIVYRLINIKKNQNLLKNVPYQKFCDLAIVYYLLLAASNEGNATILIREPQMRQWGITQEELHQIAHANTKQSLNVELKSMNTVMRELMGDDTQYVKEDPMYVLTNNMHTYGAASLLYDGIFQRMAKQMKGPYYVLPSSVHEIIIVPENAGVNNLTKLKNMVIEINRTRVQPEEILSDNVYYCNDLENYTMKIV